LIGEEGFGYRAAGFIGYHLSHKLMENEHRVIGVDNLNDYYDVTLKEARLAYLFRSEGQFDFYKMDLGDANAVSDLVSGGST